MVVQLENVSEAARMRHVDLWLTDDEAEAIASQRHSQVRDQVVRLLQYGVRERHEACEAWLGSVDGIANCNRKCTLQ